MRIIYLPMSSTGIIVKGSSSCTPSSSIPNRKMPTRQATGIITADPSNSRTKANGRSNTHNDKNRLVCRV